MIQMEHTITAEIQEAKKKEYFASQPIQIPDFKNVSLFQIANGTGIMNFNMKKIIVPSS